MLVFFNNERTQDLKEKTKYISELIKNLQPNYSKNMAEVKILYKKIIEYFHSNM